MKCLLLCHVLFICYFAKFTRAISAINSPSEIDFTYELEQINGTCVERHYSCKKSRDSFEMEYLMSHRCFCHRPCANLRACCFDSPYRNLMPTVQEPSCRRIKEQISSPFPIFIIEKCPDSTELNMKSKCEIGWKDDDDNYFLLVPVFSLATNVTYKNYFCFRCNEDHDESVYWNIRLSADIDRKTIINDTNIVPVYDHTKQSWMAPFGTGGELINISLSVENYKRSIITKVCYENVISSCPENWKDDEIRYKCYKLPTLITDFYMPYGVYKNPYCAVCNFRNLNAKNCYPSGGAFIPKFFSFSMLLDINGSDGAKVGKIQKCGDNETWDPHFEKCRRVKCALPGYVVKESKCVKP